ncbi:MAG TPA: c-type cytochrome [Porticoccaceae bacterium]|nr:c-type cytochrome [Gammaproteobacteria bacterium]HIL60714.1 c-type cytochrome [Porticoccaceae bacterium]
MLYFLASNYYIKFSMLSNWISQLLLAILFASVTSFVAVAENGEQLFLENCAECHQADGNGLANIYPALAGSEVVKGSGVDVALVLIIGRGEMPSFSGSISDEDIATIINYVRNAWGNSGDFISAKTINSLQK